jgi:hypothetical protein
MIRRLLVSSVGVQMLLTFKQEPHTSAGTTLNLLVDIQVGCDLANEAKSPSSQLKPIGCKQTSCDD